MDAFGNGKGNGNEYGKVFSIRKDDSFWYTPRDVLPRKLVVLLRKLLSERTQHMKRAIATLLLAALIAGCEYGPRHLPALCAQRDHFQSYIDTILERMAMDQEWWDSLSSDDRQYWTKYLETQQMAERARAMNSINALTENLERADEEVGVGEQKD